MSLTTVGQVITGTAVNDGDIAEKTYEDVFRTQIRDPHGFCGLFEETAAIDERTIGIRTIKIFCEQLVEAADIACLGRRGCSRG